MDMTQIIKQMTVLFLIMGTGYLCGKKGLMDEDLSKKLSSLVLNVTMPAMILASVAGGSAGYSKSAAGQVLLAGAVCYAVIVPLAFAVVRLLRVPDSQAKLYAFMIIFSNTGYMGYPVLRAIYGEGAIFLASIFNMLFDVLAYSLGVWLMSGGRGKFSPRVLVNPALISSVLALAVFMTDIKLPSVIGSTLDSLGSVTSPCAMMLIGSSLALIPAKEIFTELRLYPFSLIKQLALPLLARFILGFILGDPELLGIMTVLAAMPAASLCVMFANQYGSDAKLASKGVFITTMCSFITIPLLCSLM